MGRVADLLDILRITKQSLSRVLSQLVCEDYIQQRPGKRDRRQRLQHLLGVADPASRIAGGIRAFEEINLVGAPLPEGQSFRTVEHAVPMLSIDSLFTNDEVREFEARQDLVKHHAVQVIDQRPAQFAAAHALQEARRGLMGLRARVAGQRLTTHRPFIPVVQSSPVGRLAAAPPRE